MQELELLSTDDGSDIIDWIGGAPPLDEPVCGFHGDKCHSDGGGSPNIIFGIREIIPMARSKLIRRAWCLGYD